MANVEVPPEGPAWMLALEKKRQRIHRLAHEVGAGSPCLLCKEDCPGLDLHFWRKLCRNCKCRKEDHDVIDDCGMEQFEILLGCGNSSNRPKKAFLELLEKHTTAGLKSKAQSVAFDWVPPDVPPLIAAEYMQSLPANKLPISGSDGALYRRQQLERQLPLHDLDANHCHQLTESEVDSLEKYLENLKNNVVGQGRVSKLFIPASSSLDSLQKMCTFNSVPKPFQTHTGDDPSSNSTSHVTVGSNMNPGQPSYLKPPSAFWPKSVSPDLFQSVSPQPPSSSMMNHDTGCGASMPKLSVGAPQLSSAKGSHDSEGSEQSMHPQMGNLAKQSKPSHGLEDVINSLRFDGQLVRDHPHKSFAQSAGVPGNMWVPAECPECLNKCVDGRLVSDRVCTHIVKSDNVSHQVPAVCAQCSKKGLDGKLVCDRLCTHIQSDDASPSRQLQQVSSLDRHSPLHSTLLNSHENQLWNTIGKSQEPADSHKIISFSPSGKSSIEGVSQLPSQDTGVNDIYSLKSKPFSNNESLEEELAAPSNLRVPSPLIQEKSNHLPHNGSYQRNKSPTGVTSTAGTPYTMAMYAHNSLSGPPTNDPQDILAPHVASISIDDKAQSIDPIDEQHEQQIETNPHLNMTLYCAECKGDILPAEVVVFADRAGPEVVWHPKCFVCSTCQELLVDLVYFFSKGQVYCGRHYAELLDIPRCSACDELIFVREYTMAEGQAFHVKHFCCFECDDPLGGKQYVAKDGQPVCLPCYEKKYGKQCSTCGQVIGAKDQGVSWKDQHWHAISTCFCCYHCKKSLLGGRFAVKSQHPFCSKECMQASI